MNTTNRHMCNTCDTRIPKNRPLLVCTLCQLPKHYKCNNLSRKEAENIVANRTENSSWVCQSCYDDIFPGLTEPTVDVNNNNITNITTTLCTVCNKQCSERSRNCTTCSWCELPCHKKCHKASLGCLNCCVTMIPGYYYESHQLNGEIYVNKTRSFDPYSRESLLNQISDDIENEFVNPHLTEVSSILNRCSYKEPKNVANARKDELRVLYLNVRSLTRQGRSQNFFPGGAAGEDGLGDGAPWQNFSEIRPAP